MERAMIHLMRFKTSVFIFSAFINVLMLAGPLFMLQIYDRVLPSGSTPTLLALFAIVGILYFFMSILDWIRSRILMRLARAWHENAYLHVIKAALIKRQNFGSTNASLNPLKDLDIVRNFMSGSGSAAVYDVPFVPIYLAVLFLLHPTLGFFALFASVALVALMLSRQRAAKRYQTEATRSFDSVHAFAMTIGKQSADFVESLGIHHGLTRKLRAQHDQGLAIQQQGADQTSFYYSLMKSSRLYFQAGILALAAWLTIHNELTAGSIVAAAILMSRGLAPIEQIVANWRELSVASAANDRIRQLLSGNSVEFQKTALPVPNGKLDVHNLVCDGTVGDEPILSQINFKLDAGESLGIGGASGAGKSTLLKAVLGTWPLTEGEVRLDGALVKQWDAQSLAPHLGYLPQNPVLLPGTVAENISRFTEHPSAEAVIAAANLAKVHETILTLPDGYDTQVGPYGFPLSPGQAQRVAMACALFANPKVVVLDEPDSNLDQAGLHILKQILNLLKERKTTLLVASHRMDLLSALDKILIVGNGRQLIYGSSEQIKLHPSGSVITKHKAKEIVQAGE